MKEKAVVTSFRGAFRRVLKTSAINLAILASGVVAIELALGRWSDDFVAPQPKLLNRVFNFPQTLYEPHDNVTYAFDAYGLRTQGRPISQVQLVTIGGSTTAQMFISDGMTWQDVIRHRTGMVVANAGVDGMSSQSVDVILEDWLFKIPELKVRYYLHYHGINDAPMLQTVTIAERPKRRSWSRIIRGRSAILQGYNRIRAMLSGPLIVSHTVMAIPESPTLGVIHPHANIEKINAYVEKFYKSNLRYLIDLHRRRGQTALLVTQAVNPALVSRRDGELVVWRPDYAQWAGALDAMNEATRSVCRDNSDHCLLIDLAAEISFDRGDFYDLVHNTPQGTRKIGEYLAAKISTSLEWRP